MMKRVFIVHGWGGDSEGEWFPWLKEQLEKKGIKVFVPNLPETNKPKIENWIPALAKIVGAVDKDTYFVGHSMGCQAIARFLELLPGDQKAGGAVFVGGFFKSLTLSEENEKKLRDTWLNVPIDLSIVKSHLNKSVAIFSDDDPVVPIENKDDFKEKLDSKIIILNKRGHFARDDECFEFPEVFSALENIFD